MSQISSELSRQLSRAVSIHPYFKAHAGQLETAKAMLRQFVELTSTEAGNLYYDFTISGDEIFCREAYVTADDLLLHSASINALFGEFLQIVDVLRVELHGPADELEKLRPAFGALNPQWFVHECGVER